MDENKFVEEPQQTSSKKPNCFMRFLKWLFSMERRSPQNRLFQMCFFNLCNCFCYKRLVSGKLLYRGLYRR